MCRYKVLIILMVQKVESREVSNDAEDDWFVESRGVFKLSLGFQVSDPDEAARSQEEVEKTLQSTGKS